MPSRGNYLIASTIRIWRSMGNRWIFSMRRIDGWRNMIVTWTMMDRIIMRSNISRVVVIIRRNLINHLEDEVDRRSERVKRCWRSCFFECTNKEVHSTAPSKTGRNRFRDRGIPPDPTPLTKNADHFNEKNRIFRSGMSGFDEVRTYFCHPGKGSGWMMIIRERMIKRKVVIIRSVCWPF